MSKQMQILLGVVGVVVLAAVVLTMFGKPPNLPLGPLQGMLAKEEAATDGSVVADGGGAITPVDCVPGADPAAGGVVDPAAGGAVDPAAGGAVDPAAGGAVDPAAGGAVDPAAGGAVDPAAAGTTDPAAAPVAAPGDGWSGDARVTAASAGTYDGSRVSDTRIVAADATAVDPAAGGALDPAATGTTDPAATDTTDPAAGVADPCAPGVGGAATTDPGAGGAIDPAAGAGAGAGAGATTPAAGAGAGAAAAPSKQTTEGTSTGNSPEALRAAKDATGVMQKAQIQVTTTATLVPSAGGVGRPAAMRRYRQGVTAAVLMMKLDASAQQQWTSAGKKVQTDLVMSFIKRLARSYPKASRSITVVDSSGNVLAIGDAPPRAAGAVKIY